MTRAATVVHAVDDSVNGLRARRGVSDRRAAAILVAVGDAQAALRPYLATTTLPNTTSTTVPLPSSPSGGKHDGRGNNHDGGDGND